MAGDCMEEPFRLGFQAESLHSGSISFGRFEAESLSWERRSSFSHNRYLEEAEKISKPGSVTEKKAYFEAHFRKQALLRQASSEGQNERSSLVSGHDKERTLTEEGNDVENISYREEYEASDVGNMSFREEYQPNDVRSISYKEEYDANDVEKTYYSEEHEHIDEIDDVADYDESPDGSECYQYLKELQHEDQEVGNDDSESQMTKEFLDYEENVESVDPEGNMLECECPEEMHQSESVSHEPTIPKGEQNIEVECCVNHDGINVLKGIDTSLAGEAVSPSLENLRNQDPKAREESKVLEPGSKSQVDISQACRTETVKSTGQNAGWRERQTPLRSRTGKQLPQSTTSSFRSSSKLFKEESPQVSGANSLSDNKSSQKEIKMKRAVELQPSTPETTESRVQQSMNRTKHIITSSKKEMIPNAMSFNLRSGERAEKRREFHSKMEEKMHTKEVETNQLQAKTLEKTEAEMRQFRKSLNFKAKPLPSFYRKAVPLGSSEHKAMANNTRSTKVQSKSSHLTVSRTATGSKMDNNSKTIPACETVKIAELQLASEGQGNGVAETSTSFAFSPAQSSSGNHVPRAGMKTEVVGKKERQKETNMQKHSGADAKTIKGAKLEAKQKLGHRSSRSGSVRKDVKGMSIGHRSDVGQLTVGVAS
ncbi:hypothetical protein Ancab_018439 [Ancistrocladus abbreviatus]